MGWRSPTSLIWLFGHLCMILIGIVLIDGNLFETIVRPDVILGVGGFFSLVEISKGTKGSQKKARQLSELHRCLTALYSLSGPASCEKISDETGKLGAPVRVYNTNRALKEVPEFASRLQSSDAVLQYEITKRGQLFLYLLELLRGPVPHSLELPFS